MKRITLLIAFLVVFAFLGTLNVPSVYATGGEGRRCPEGYTFNLDQQRCVPCPPPGPYGISVCPDTGIIFGEEVSVATEILAGSVVALGIGTVLLANGKFIRNKLQK